MEKLEEICTDLTQEKHDLAVKANNYDNLEKAYESLREDHKRVVSELLEAKEAQNRLPHLEESHLKEAELYMAQNADLHKERDSIQDSLLLTHTKYESLRLQFEDLKQHTEARDSEIIGIQGAIQLKEATYNQ